MADTIDVLGEQTTLDKLVEKSLTEFEDSTMTKINSTFFGYNSVLEKAVLKNCSYVESSTFSDSSNITELVFGKKCTFSSSVFSGNTHLKYLRLMADECCSFTKSKSTFENTPIGKKNGGIFVPVELIPIYVKSNIGFYRHCIFPEDDYPRDTCVTISDSWDEIIASCNDGSYASKYIVGDIAKLEFNDKAYYFIVAAKNSDIRTDGNGNAHITWIAISAPYITRIMKNDTSYVNWADSRIRSFLNSSFYEQIPENVRNAILQVRKTFFDASTESTLISDDKIWIPSIRELGGSSAGYSYEDDGVIYQDLFSQDDAYSRVFLTDTGSSMLHWTRTLSSKTAGKFLCISDTDCAITEVAQTNVYTCFRPCFCT